MASDSGAEEERRDILNEFLKVLTKPTKKKIKKKQRAQTAAEMELPVEDVERNPNLKPLEPPTVTKRQKVEPESASPKNTIDTNEISTVEDIVSRVLSNIKRPRPYNQIAYELYNILEDYFYLIVLARNDPSKFGLDDELQPHECEMPDVNGVESQFGADASQNRF